jgi:hypothetical protein
LAGDSVFFTGDSVFFPLETDFFVDFFAEAFG